MFRCHKHKEDYNNNNNNDDDDITLKIEMLEAFI